MSEGYIDETPIDLTWEILNEHLADPVRARIFFELMFNTTTPLQIKYFQEITGKGRTTINHHIEKMIEDGIVVVEEKVSHTRGKPTRMFVVNPQFVTSLRQDKILPRSEDVVISDALRHSSHLLMLGNVAKQSAIWLRDNRPDAQTDFNEIKQLDIPFYLNDIKNIEVLNVYLKHLQKALRNIEQELNINDLNLTVSSNFQHVFVAGFVPVYRDV